MKKLFKILLIFIVINVLVFPINLILWDMRYWESDALLLTSLACWWYLILLILSYFVDRDLL